VLLAEGRQVYEIVRRHLLDRVAGFAPSRQAAHDYERVESLFPQQMRHTGARGFA